MEPAAWAAASRATRVASAKLQPPFGGATQGFVLTKNRSSAPVCVLAWKAPGEGGERSTRETGFQPVRSSCYWLRAVPAAPSPCRSRSERQSPIRGLRSEKSGVYGGGGEQPSTPSLAGNNRGGLTALSLLMSPEPSQTPRSWAYCESVNLATQGCSLRMPSTCCCHHAARAGLSRSMSAAVRAFCAAPCPSKGMGMWRSAP